MAVTFIRWSGNNHRPRACNSSRRLERFHLRNGLPCAGYLKTNDNAPDYPRCKYMCNISVHILPLLIYICLCSTDFIIQVLRISRFVQVKFRVAFWSRNYKNLLYKYIYYIFTGIEHSARPIIQINCHYISCELNIRAIIYLRYCTSSPSLFAFLICLLFACLHPSPICLHFCPVYLHSRYKGLCTRGTKLVTVMESKLSPTPSPILCPRAEKSCSRLEGVDETFVQRREASRISETKNVSKCERTAVNKEKEERRKFRTRNSPEADWSFLLRDNNVVLGRYACKFRLGALTSDISLHGGNESHLWPSSLTLDEEEFR